MVLARALLSAGLSHADQKVAGISDLVDANHI